MVIVVVVVVVRYRWLHCRKNASKDAFDRLDQENTYVRGTRGWFYGLACPPKTHVLKDWLPMQQCSEVGLWGSDWIKRVLTSSGLIH